MASPSRLFPFKRNLSVSPVMIPAKDVSTYVPLGSLPDGVTTFAAVNAFPVFIRLIGTPHGSATVPAKDWDGWIFPPGHFGIYSTQNPKGLSAIAVARPGYPIVDSNGALLYPDAQLELMYGSGA